MDFVVALVIIGIILIITNRFLLNFWTRKQIPQSSPKAFFGDFKDAFLHTKSIADITKRIYQYSKKDRIFGVYISYRPMLFINDPQIIHDIMNKDSVYFPDRGLHHNEHFDPLSEQIFFQGGKKWRKLRLKLTPAFTSGKLKAMLPIVTKNLKLLDEFIAKKIDEGEQVFEFRDLVARMNTNIITSVAFGIEVDTINDPTHVMRQMGVKVFEPNFVAGLRFFTSFFMPKVNQLFNFKFVSDEVERFFTSIITENVNYREENEFHRNDLMQTLIQLKNEGFMTGDDKNVDNGEIGDMKKITIADVCGQSFGFYLGGFETTSTTVSFCLHELAKNQRVQRKVQAEIDEKFRITDDGSEMYKIVKSMKYLESCMHETLRKYPPLPILNRKCAQDYKISDSDFIIPKGTPVIIPVFGLQRDPDIYENPLEFKPERFLNNASGSDAEGSYYLPFGEGIRVCIGHRMGKQNTCYQLALLLSKYNFELVTDGEQEITLNPNQLFLQPIGNIHLKTSLRKKTN